MVMKWNGEAVKSHLLAKADETKKALAELIAERAYQLCPKDTHRLANSIGVIESNIGDVYIVICREYYAPFVEFGHMDGLHGGGWVPGQFFMTRAIMEGAAAAPEIVASHFNLGNVSSTSSGHVGASIGGNETPNPAPFSPN